jgi:hypothetical protein
MPKPRPFKLKPGDRVGNYRILNRVGGRYEGEVYKVLERPTDVIRALKLFRTDELSSIRQLAHIAWYFEQVRSSEHFPVYHYYGQWLFDDDEGCGFLVFDFVKGPTLRQYLKNAPGSKERLFLALARAFTDVHKCHYHKHHFAVGDQDDLDNAIVAKVRNHDGLRIVFVDCYPGVPEHHNKDFSRDCHELVTVARKIFGKSKPIAVQRILKGIAGRKRFTSTTLRDILEASKVDMK